MIFSRDTRLTEGRKTRVSPANRIRLASKVAGLAVSAVLLALMAGPAYSTATVPQVKVHDTAGMFADAPASIKWGKPAWADTFNGTELNLKRWTVYDDPTGKYSGWKRTLQSVKVHDGSLEIIGHYQRPYGYVGGGLSYNLNQTYGRWAVRFRADSGSGWEPVVLLWPKGKWPDDGEIDMAEISNPSRHGAGEFVHLGAKNQQVGQPIPSSADFTKWHILAVDWLPSHITFWLDGKPLWTIKRAKGRRNFIPSTPFHLAMQNDVGCATHLCKPNKSTPRRVIMQVDWIRIWTAPAGAR